MDQYEEVVYDWSDTVYGESPNKLSIWSKDEDYVQAFMRFSNKVVAVHLLTFGGEISEEARLEIDDMNWNPGSIQARQLKNGTVRIKHRTREIFLVPQIRAPEWAAALLEEWLMGIRSESTKFGTKSARYSDLKRKKETITRLLEQVDFDVIKDDIKYTRGRLESADKGLSGK